MLKWWKKETPPAVDIEKLTKEIEERVRASLTPPPAPEPVPEPTPEPEPTGPKLVVTIECKQKPDGGLEAVYTVESNEAGIHQIDRAYAEMPKWNALASDQEKVVLFLYDAISTLAEPLLPDPTVTELDIRREVLSAPVANQKWVTDEVDIATRGR